MIRATPIKRSTHIYMGLSCDCNMIPHWLFPYLDSRGNEHNVCKPCAHVHYCDLIKICHDSNT